MPSGFDGDVKIRVSLDSKGVEKGADRVKRRMESLSKSVAKTFSTNARRKDIEENIAAYEEQTQAVEKSIRAEKERLTELKRLRKEIEYDPQARETVDKMGITDIDAEIDSSYVKIAGMRKEARGFNSEIRQSNSELKNMGQEVNPVADKIEKLTRRINKLAIRAFVFNIISSGLRTMRTRLVQLLEQDSAVSKSMAEIKGSLVAAFMSIYNLCIPAVRSIISWLSKLTAAISDTIREVSEMIGSIFGIDTSSLENADALLEQADATTAAGEAAEEASKSLAAFDEINQLSDSSSSSSGDSSGTTTSSWDFSALDTVSDKFSAISKIVLAIGSAIALWKLSKVASSLSTISGIAGAIYSVFELIVPSVQDIMENGLTIENTLGLISGILLTAGFTSLASGNFGSAIFWLALGAAALIALNWDKVSEALKVWDEKISKMIEDIPILKNLYEGFKNVVISIVEAFKEIAGIIVDIGTEGLSFDIVAEIGDMSFTSKAIVSVVTAKLVATIGKMFGLSGTIGIKAGGIVLGLIAGIDLVTDILDVVQGEGEDRSQALMELITKMLFGAMAAVITVALGGSGFALMYTVPIGIELAKTFLDRETTKQAMERQQEMNSGKLDEAILAAQSVQELQDIVSGFTNLTVTDDVFKNIIGADTLAELTATEEGFEELKYLVMDFTTLFYKQSGTAGFEQWLESLGLLSSKANNISESLTTSAETTEKFSRKAAETKETVSELTQQIENVPDVDVGTSNLEDAETAAVHLESNLGDIQTAMENAGTASVGLESNFADIETAIGSTQTAAEGLKTVLGDEMTDTYTEMQNGARSTSSTMSGVFTVASTRIRNTIKNNLTNAFSSFNSGGAVFNGITDGIDKIFTRVVNKLIDGLNTVLNESFDKINDALDKIRNTKIDGIKPFISLPRVSISKIPKLAQGAVIPANNEFLAILGDQKQGTNIEAPLDTIVEAVMTAMTKSGMDSESIGTAVRSAMQGLAFKVGKREIGYVVADAINSNRRSDGKIALNL